MPYVTKIEKFFWLIHTIVVGVEVELIGQNPDNGFSCLVSRG